MKKTRNAEAYWRQRELDRIKHINRQFTIKAIGSFVCMVLFLIMLMLYMNTISKQPVKEQTKKSEYDKY